MHSDGVGHAAPHRIFEIDGHQHFATQAWKFIPMVLATPLPTGFPNRMATNSSQHKRGNAFRWCLPRRSPQDFRNRWPQTLRNTNGEMNSEGVGHAAPRRISEIDGDTQFATQAGKLIPKVLATPLPQDFRNRLQQTLRNTHGEMHSEGVGHAAPHRISEIDGHKHFATQAEKCIQKVLATPLPTGFQKSIATNMSQHHAEKPMIF